MDKSGLMITIAIQAVLGWFSHFKTWFMLAIAGSAFSQGSE
jgi:hypothetical protein